MNTVVAPGSDAKVWLHGWWSEASEGQRVADQLWVVERMKTVDAAEVAKGRAWLEGLLGHLRELAGLGVDHVMLSPRGLWTEQTLAAVASILPHAHAIGVDTGR